MRPGSPARRRLSGGGLRCLAPDDGRAQNVGSNAQRALKSSENSLGDFALAQAPSPFWACGYVDNGVLALVKDFSQIHRFSS